MAIGILSGWFYLVRNVYLRCCRLRRIGAICQTDHEGLKLDGRNVGGAEIRFQVFRELLDEYGYVDFEDFASESWRRFLLEYVPSATPRHHKCRATIDQNDFVLRFDDQDWIYQFSYPQDIQEIRDFLEGHGIPQP